MKKIFSYLFLICSMAILFAACKKDEVKTILNKSTPPVLSASQTSVVLSSATAADTVEAFTWSRSDYGFNAAASYSLQIAKGGTNFSAPKEISMGNSTSLKYSGADLNQIALILGLAPGSAQGLDVRVKSTLTDSLVIFSNSLAIDISPYFVIINYPSLSVPGEYQATQWDPASAAKISSKAANGIYEGYVNFTAGNLNFKYTSDPDWNHTIYGWAGSTVTGSDVAGTINTSGGNLFVPGPGYYVLKANTNTNIWSGKKTTWGIIGDGPTLSNNWSNDVPMTYDPATQVWTVTTTFVAGNFKFRANGDWSDGTNNFGDTGADLSLEYGGDNIAVTAGTYTVTLDLHVPGNYTYKIQ
ncbi:MAG: SusE domain-containing protein [Ginsengibacter sp.]